MTFAYTRSHRTISGDRWESWGTWTNASGDTGGDIQTGLNYIESVWLSYTGSAVVVSAPVVNETLPKSGDGITIVTVDNADGVWLAKGRM
jgi:hypothetical protein